MAEAQTTTDHDTIRRWAEDRGGHPATVADTSDGGAGVLRIDFEEEQPDERLEPISWDEFFAKFEEADLVDPAGAEAAPAIASAPSVAPAPPDASPLERYEAALAIFRSGDTTRAEAEFRRLLESGAPPDLADNAWFWIGEARFGRGDAAGAASAYRTAIERYPDGNKIPDALLKLGDAMVELGDADAAQEVWRELVERFPSTASAEIARPRLEPR